MNAPCLKCGRPTQELIAFCGKLEGKVFLCDRCFDIAITELAEHRRQFEELLAAGVSRKDANAIMIERIDAQNGRSIGRS